LPAGVVVDVEMLAIHERRSYRHAPGGIERVIEVGDPVAVERADFVVVARDLADADLRAARARLVLVDRFVAQVDSRAGLGPGALHVERSIYAAERRAAGSACGNRHR